MSTFPNLALPARHTKDAAMKLFRRLARRRRRKREVRRQRDAQRAYEAHLAPKRREEITFDVFGPGSRPR